MTTPDTDSAVTDAQAGTEHARTRVIAAAGALIAADGRDAATTRAVAAAAGVQAPTIYRLFGDKRGLLDAVAEHGFAAYVAEKSRREPHADPLQALRDGWDMHVAFGLAHPGLFAILSGDAQPRPSLPAVAAGEQILRRKIGNVARVGRLRVSERRAMALLQSACIGTVLTLLGDTEEQRDPGLSNAAREAVMAAITGQPLAIMDAGSRGAATALRASLSETSALTHGERHLLEELLDRIADGGS